MKSTSSLLKDGLGWGFLLWFIGYVAGMILFFVVPVSLIGWIITPLACVLTAWILYKKIHSNSFRHYMWVALIWTAIAVVFDYIMIVKMLSPADGYYKPDVYLYYLLTLTLPLVIGWRKSIGSKVVL